MKQQSLEAFRDWEYWVWLGQWISFTAAHVMLCMRFVTKPVLMHTSVLVAVSRPPVSPSDPYSEQGYGWTRSSEATQLGQLTQVTKDMFQYRIKSCSAIKLGMFLQSRRWSEPCWVLVCWWKVVIDYFCITYFFLHLSAFISSHIFSSVLPFNFSPPPHCKGVSKEWDRSSAASHGELTT